MSYNESLSDRVREIISATNQAIEEKKMFGGNCFMVNNKMCVGIREDKMMVRFNPDIYEEVLEKMDCEPMTFTGKAMKGYVYVALENLNTKKKLMHWVQLALEYNKIAKSSKKK